MEHGEVEASIIAQALRTNRPIPEKLRNAPRLMTGLDLYYDAFMDLTSCRTMGFGMGQIPWTTINDYAVANKFSEEQTEDLLHHIRFMDHAYLDHWNKKQKDKQGNVGKDRREARERTPMGREKT